MMDPDTYFLIPQMEKIFFALKKVYDEGYVVCVDQRKRVVQCHRATELLDRANIIPKYQKPITLIRGLCSLYPRFQHNPEDLPQDTFVVSYSTHTSYHGTLFCHPAAIPCVNINYDNKSVLLNNSIFSGRKSY